MGSRKIRRYRPPMVRNNTVYDYNFQIREKAADGTDMEWHVECNNTYVLWAAFEVVKQRYPKAVLEVTNGARIMERWDPRKDAPDKASESEASHGNE